MKWSAPIAIVVISLFAAACGDDYGGGVSGGEVTVFAASSLTEAFEEIADGFSEEAGTDVTFNFAGSQKLRTQLVQGARADVFASANGKQMTLAQQAGVVAPESQVFARNRPVVIVPKDNEAGIETLQDLANDGVKAVLAGEEVPVGGYSRDFLEKASQHPDFNADYGEKVMANVVSEETNVRQVAVKVQLGEADAGIVYTTDVTADLAPDVTVIEIPDELNEIAEYPIAITREPGDAATAQAFVDYVLGEAGQDILAKHGFISVGP